MGLISWIRRKLTKPVKNPYADADAGFSRILGALNTQSIPPARSAKEWLRLFSEQPFLHGPVHRICEKVASYSPKLYYKRGEHKEEVKEHLLLDVLKKPNPYMSGTALRHLSQTYMEVCGECFWIIERNALRGISEIWPLPPYWVQQTATQTNPFYVANLKGRPMPIPSEDMLWFKNVNPIEPYDRGKGEAEAAVNEIETDDYAAKWNKGFFRNQARPDFVFTSPSVIGEVQSRRLLETWEQKYRGYMNAFKPAILDNGLTLHDITRKHDEMDFLGGRVFHRNTIAGVWGIPLSVLGITEDVNRANAEAGNTLFAEVIVLPRLNFWSEELTWKLASAIDPYLVVEYDNPIPDDKAFELSKADSGFAGGKITLNEWRKSQGWQERPDGDVLYVPINVIVTKTLKAESGELPPVAPPPVKPSVEVLPPKQIKKALDYTFDIDGWNKLAMEELGPLLEAVMMDSGEKESSEFGLSFEVNNPDVKTFVKEHVEDYFLKKCSINNTTSDAIAKAIQEGYDEGEGNEKVAERIRQVFADARGYRAEMIARTEMNRGANLGALLSYKQAGVEGKWWLTCVDGRERDTHRIANINYAEIRAIPIDAEFILRDAGGNEVARCLAPGTTNVAGEDIHCRCRVMPVNKLKGMNAARAKAYSQAWMKHLELYERRFIRALDRYFSKQEREVLKHVQ